MLTISRAPSSDVKLTITATIPEGGVISYDNWEIGERMPDLVDTESHTRGCRVHRRETQVERAPAELELVHVVAEVEIAAEQSALLSQSRRKVVIDDPGHGFRRNPVAEDARTKHGHTSGFRGFNVRLRRSPELTQLRSPKLTQLA
jgi:hypothetical protein